MSQTTKTLIGALVAAALAIAVYYGVIGQQTATSIQNQTNQTLGTAPANQGSTASPQGQGTATTPRAASPAPVPANDAPAPPR